MKSQLLIFFALLLACSLPKGTGRSRNKPIRSGLRLETLDNLTYEQLPEFGVLAPGQKDHVRGKGLVLMSIASTSFGQGNWVRAHGLLGVSMLDCSVRYCNAYRSPFGFDRAGRQRKMSEALELDNAILLTTVSEPQTVPSFTVPVTGRSTIVRREAVIYALSSHLRERFSYDRAGNYGRHYTSRPGHTASRNVIGDLRVGVAVHGELLGKGYRDEKLPSDHNREFVEEMEDQLRDRDAKVDDQMLLPEHPDQLQALLRILDADLDVLPSETKRE